MLLDVSIQRATDTIPVNTKHLHNICTMLGQRRRRWSGIAQMLYNTWSHRPDDKYIALDFGKLAPKTPLLTLYLKYR